jgi:acetyltransferase-like isoleucine patch superfamily enzyme
MRVFFHALLSDARLYRRLTRPGKSAHFPALVWTLLTNRGLWLRTAHRIGRYCVVNHNLRNPLWWVARVSLVVVTYLSAVLCRSETRGDCDIGPETYLSNDGYLICGARSIGAGSVIHGHCTFGFAVASRSEGRPFIGKNVWIGPDCIITGGVTVGDGATLLPGSFLTYSVPPGAVVKGNPARVIRQGYDNSTLRSSLAVVTDLAPEREALRS